MLLKLRVVLDFQESLGNWNQITLHLIQYYYL